MNWQRSFRAHVRRLLAWNDAHVGFDQAVRGIPAHLRDVAPPGLPHSAWQLVEHMRLAQADILEFCRAKAYRRKHWPGDYWPDRDLGLHPRDWSKSIAAYRRDRASLMKLATNRNTDPLARVPNGSGQTYLRELLLVADHTAYHVGQLILVRRALGIWTR